MIILLFSKIIVCEFLIGFYVSEGSPRGRGWGRGGRGRGRARGESHLRSL